MNHSAVEVRPRKRTREAVVRRRQATQRLSSAPLSRAADAVRLLTCVQSQERDHAFFSLALRSRARTYADVQAELDRGAFLRTHILRPTWHFVAPEDLRWILALTSPRVERGMAARHRQLGLDDPRVMGRGLDLLGELLRGRRFLTRPEIGAEFAARGSSVATGPELGHLLLVAELRGLICSGPMKGVHHSYALVDEVVPDTPALDRDEAVARLAQRFFAGHGPASVHDFTRWSSLTVADTRRALGELDGRLACVEVDGTPLWFDPEVPARTTAEHSAYLLPVYDEAVLTYPRLGFPVAADHPAPQPPDPFWARVLLDRREVGLWKRTVRPEAVEVEAWLAPGTDEAGRASVHDAALRMARFLGRELDLRVR
ncbi:MAG TPA: winged helix DNA-binding domain-containing protein [Segeticoccus sp.]|uniref:winged helix DNA-binding domain-containing protein n=1 Tax=Segeticoccus sp. TaxID=2706531 RepID=UPI002D7ED149|nr:winged helix DNA-binding domain-containing protein [Segeticoccus sp.]HET8599815.1 winged helix DNA-binding domain-containing protein [Segeticoccus sp.]